MSSALMSLLPATWPAEVACKCCDCAAPLYGVVDFNKNCESRRRQVLKFTGIPIYYYRCPACQLIFTTALDRFSRDDLLEHIYNADYLLVDPEYAEFRPRDNAVRIQRLLPAARPARLLDYGGGNGLFAECMRGAGFPHVAIYDPLVAEYAARPEGSFDCITCLEVAEHSPDPAATFRELSDLLCDPGLIVLSTLVQPADIDRHGVNWWYLGPRNGHISLYSRASLAKLAGPLGLRFGSFNDSWHVLFRNVPDFARHLVRTA
jgi:2-polyprenyl-6-hydroxyphenyl methylase/3-demethylubiquinone-9 3-methyltransferase